MRARVLQCRFNRGIKNFKGGESYEGLGASWGRGQLWSFGGHFCGEPVYARSASLQNSERNRDSKAQKDRWPCKVQRTVTIYCLLLELIGAILPEGSANRASQFEQDQVQRLLKTVKLLA